MLQVFDVNINVTAVISNLTITGGHAGQVGSAGINNAGTLTMTNDVVTGNSSTQGGGGIYNSGIATLTNVTVSNNSGIGDAGAFNSGFMSIADSVFTMNTCTISGRRTTTRR